MGLTQQLARLREMTRLMQQGHLHRIEQVSRDMTRLPPGARKQAAEAIRQYCKEVSLDRRIERLDRAVAETEKRIRDLTQQAITSLDAHEYRKVPQILDEARKLQRHNTKLMKIIDRTEEKLTEQIQKTSRSLGG